MNNSFKSLFIEFHIIQSFAVACLNRDDMGSPKTAIVGGVERARVSSQCWKYAVRKELHGMGITLGSRTKKVDVALTQLLIEKGVDADIAAVSSEAVCSKIASDTLVFITEKEMIALADMIIERNFELKDVVGTPGRQSGQSQNGFKLDKEIQKILKGVINSGLDAIDVALFGRMVAKINDISMEGATCFAHAISTHKVDNEIDYFTGNDDLNDQNWQASHIGEKEYNSATYYRYVTLNIGQLVDNLFGHGEINISVLSAAVEAFIEALYASVPHARQNSMTSFSPWDYGRITIRKGQAIQAKFEEPIQNVKGGGYGKPSIACLKSQITNHQKRLGERRYGNHFSIEIGEEIDTSLDEVLIGVRNALSSLHAA